MITAKEAWVIYAKYVSGWRAVSDKERRQIATEIIDENAQYSSPILELGGIESMIARMSKFQEEFPGGYFEIGGASAHHDVALLTWIIMKADGTEFARGHDQMRVSPEGKILSMTTFAPPITEI